MGGVTYSRPELLQPNHRLDTFACADSSLEHWLQHRARKNHAVGVSRVFVVRTHAGEVAGYYALAAGSLSRAASPGRVRRNMPDPVPVAVLGRLAVHQDHAGMGIGAGLLKDAVLRVRGLSEELGIRALLCHAINEDALSFYIHHGFLVSPVEPMTVMLPLR